MSAPQETRRAQAIWEAGRRPDPQHPYLVKHRIGGLNLRQTRQGALILPLCIRGQFHGIRLIHWDMTQPITTFGGAQTGCYVPTGRHASGQTLAVVVDWPSAATLHKRGITAWASICLDNLGVVALQARSSIGTDGQLLVVGDNTEEGARRADQVATSRGGELLLPGRPIGAPKWVATFNDLARWDAGERRATL